MLLAGSLLGLSTRECAGAGPLPRLTARDSHSSASGRQEKVFRVHESCTALKIQTCKICKVPSKADPDQATFQCRGLDLKSRFRKQQKQTKMITICTRSSSCGCRSFAFLPHENTLPYTPGTVNILFNDNIKIRFEVQDLIT